MSCVTDSETATPRAGHAERAKLMIVDDDPEVRIIVAEFLQDFGYQVIQASSGAEALDLLAQIARSKSAGAEIEVWFQRPRCGRDPFASLNELR